MRFIHTADWQIGKPFRQFGDNEAVLRNARLAAIESIARLAEREGCTDVLVAGDVYDSESPLPRTMHEPLERMRRFPRLRWHLLPGNHDPHRPQGVWDRVRADGTPDNVHLHLSATPLSIGEAVILPAPLTRKTESGDLTEWMAGAATPAGSIRIGLAHGSVTNFGVEGEAANPIDPARPQQAGLDYLALGDWHRTVRVGPACWYAGTPEPDRAGSGNQEDGQALLVEIAGPGAPPGVTPHTVGTYRWLTREAEIGDAAALDDLEAQLRALPDASRTLLRLKLSGTLPLAERTRLDGRLGRLEAALFDLRADLSALRVRPTDADLETIDFSGVLRQAADRLKAQADDPALTAEARRRAGDALVELFVLAEAGNRP